MQKSCTWSHQTGSKRHRVHCNRGTHGVLIINKEKEEVIKKAVGWSILIANRCSLHAGASRVVEKFVACLLQ
jgi:hypothetical protein